MTPIRSESSSSPAWLCRALRRSLLMVSVAIRSGSGGGSVEFPLSDSSTTTVCSSFVTSSRATLEMIRPVAMRSRSWPTSRASDRMSWRASMSSATSCAVWPPSSCSSRRMLSSAPTMSSADTSSRRTSPSRLASPARRRIASAARRIESVRFTLNPGTSWTLDRASTWLMNASVLDSARTTSSVVVWLPTKVAKASAVSAMIA
mmetsp:Transcript_15108/g.57388  ORF Transcript_15108/g.57388 Transcript_15108/m.57388 type:complete len:204 (-) Transcript_15108:944-1555(-)